MDQPTPPTTSASLTPSEATTNFLAKHQAQLQSTIVSLASENKAFSTKLELCKTRGPLLASDTSDWRANAIACEKEAAEELVQIMKDFDKEVGRAEDRQMVEEMLKEKFAIVRLNRSLVQTFKETIAQYEARDG